MLFGQKPEARAKEIMQFLRLYIFRRKPWDWLLTKDTLPSALSRLNFGIEPLQLDPCFLDGELPIDGSLLFVHADRPSTSFGLQRLDIADPSVLQALAGHATQFALCHVQPTPVLGSVHEVDPPHVVASLVGRKCFVERPLGVRVQIIANQCDAARRSRSANRANGLLHEPNHPWCGVAEPLLVGSFESGSANIKILAVPFRSYS